MDRPLSRALHQRAERAIPGGVNSPVRAFSAVGLPPLFAARGQGQYLYDVDSNRYIDYLMSWGALVLGHCHPDVVKAVVKAAGSGSGFVHCGFPRGLSSWLRCRGVRTE